MVTTRFKRTVTAFLVAVLAAIVACLPMSQASSDEGWTWSSATYPAGSVNIFQGSGGGGVWKYQGMYYVPGAGHMDQPVGRWFDVFRPGTGGYGHVSHTTYANGTSGFPDLGLIATGTRPIAPKMRVSDWWLDAPISGVGGPAALTTGSWVCHSGFSWYTEQANGYRCGQITVDCLITQKLCYASSPTGLAAPADSGGPVWWYSPTGVTLLGWVTSGFGNELVPGGHNRPGMAFVPAWTVQQQVWTAAQTWQGEPGVAPFPSGQHSTGCFVTTRGCLLAGQ